MTLHELAVEYRVSGERCKARVRELRRELEAEDMSDSARMVLRRRITILTSMGRDAISTSRYLERYYGAYRN